MNDIFGKVKESGDYPYATQVCPACKRVFAVGSIRQHITILAKQEAFAYLLREIKSMPHFQIYKEYTIKARTPSLTNRVWTD